MKRRFLSVLATAMLIAVSAAPSAAHEGHIMPPLEADGSTAPSPNDFLYYIPVCLHDNINGSQNEWNVTGNAVHSRINAAMAQWNDLGGEFFFYRTDSSCTWLHQNHPDPFVQIGYSGSDIGPGAVAQTRQVTVRDCAWCSIYRMGSTDGVSPSHIIPIWINEVAHNFYWGTGGPTLPDGYFDGWSVILHELGHVVGENHTPAYSPSGSGPDVMEEYLPPGPSWHAINRVLSSHDIWGYTYQYGTTH